MANQAADLQGVYIYIPDSTPKIDGVEELFMELGPKTGEKSWYDKENS